MIDTETTGLYPYGREYEYLEYVPDEMLQLSIINAATGRKLYDKLLWPAHHKRWTEAEMTNHISYDMVRNAPSVYEERSRIQEIIDGARVLIGYNTSFDMGFMEAAGISFDKVKWAIDVMDDFAAHYGEFVDWAEDYKWQKLTKAARLTDYDQQYWAAIDGRSTAHDSLEDCKATLHVAKWLEAHPDQMLKNALYY